MAKDNGERAALPYGSWKSVKAFLGKLNKTTIPPRIDSSVMVGMSGSGKSEMRTALRYLGLIDSADTVTPKMLELVKAYGTAMWSDLLSDRVMAAYDSVLGQDPEWIDNGTPQLLREKFKGASGMDGNALDKATRFFLAALDDAGVSYSPHFKVRGARTPTPRKPANKGSRKSDENDGRPPKSPPPTGTVQLPFSIPGKAAAMVQVPTDLTEAEWTMIDTYLRGYVKLPSSSKK